MIHPEDIREDTGNTVLVPCLAISEVLPSITWIRNSDQATLVNATTSRVNTYNKKILFGGYTFWRSVLEVCNIREMDDSGYTCIADNGFASSSATFRLSLTGALFFFLQWKL